MKSNHPIVCVPVCERNQKAVGQATLRAVPLADIVEFRIDCLEDPLRQFESIVDVARRVDKPVILTLRPTEEGGNFPLTYSQRKEFWSRHGNSFSFVDLEYDLVRDFAAAETAPFDWDQVICSHHDFNSVPPDLVPWYEQMAQTPAGLLKIAVAATDICDCLAIFRLLDRARGDGRVLIALAMGMPGLATRILGPSRGSYLTYAALDDASGTAPGQIVASELRQLYRIEQITERTSITGIIGSPVSHSLSPQLHNAAFSDMGMDAVYIPFEVRNVDEFLNRMVHPNTRELDWNLRGFSVTAPHKSTVMKYLDWIEPTAYEIGAVNTVVIEGDELHGYNTDAPSALKPVIDRLGSIRDMRCAVIGSGGAARAVLWGLKRWGAQATLFARHPIKAQTLVAEFEVELRSLSAASFGGFDVVVNTTPLGTSGALQNQTPATAKELAGARLAYDLVYNPSETLFLREALAAGCDTASGLGMLIDQAAEQFRIWTGMPAPVAVMNAAAAAYIKAQAALTIGT